MRFKSPWGHKKQPLSKQGLFAFCQDKTGIPYGDEIQVPLGAHFLNFGDVLYT